MEKFLVQLAVWNFSVYFNFRVAVSINFKNCCLTGNIFQLFWQFWSSLIYWEPRRRRNTVGRSGYVVDCNCCICQLTSWSDSRRLIGKFIDCIIINVFPLCVTSSSCLLAQEICEGSRRNISNQDRCCSSLLVCWFHFYGRRRNCAEAINKHESSHCWRTLRCNK